MLVRFREIEPGDKMARVVTCLTGALILITSLLPSTAADAHGAQVRRDSVALSKFVTEPGKHPLDVRTIRGGVDFTVTGTWVRDRAANRIEAQYEVNLPGGCTARVNVYDWVGVLEHSPQSEVTSDVDFWYSIFHPTGPVPVPVLTRHRSHGRLWELVTPPTLISQASQPEIEENERKKREVPMYGVQVEQLRGTNVWTALLLGLHTPPPCTRPLAQEAELRAQLEQLLRSARGHGTLLRRERV
jgi:hypothetical protein